MYFVITKNTGTEAAKAEDADDPNEGDVQFLTSMKDARKNEIRNHVTSFGLLVIALFFVMMMIDAFNPGAAVNPELTSIYLPGALFGIFLLLCGIVLLILGKRVMAAVTFILMSSQMLSVTVLEDIAMLNILSGIIYFIFALILMTSKDKQKYAFAIVNLLLGITSIARIYDNQIFWIIMALSAVFLIWLSIACGTGKLRHSISKYLTENGDVTFRRCGSVIGYLLLAKTLIIVLIYEFNDPTFTTILDSATTLGIIHVCLLVLVGLLLICIGKRRVTSIFFIGAGLALALDLISPEIFGYLPVILLLVLGIQNVLRKDPRILPSFLLIGDAFATMLFYNLAEFPEVKTAMLLLTLMCTVIAVYLSFAVFAEKPKLPLF
ncbi:MAG TPA: hypothetical protein O0X19_03365 [Methanocorpusculum sp.]|nr:hypothetical protein [Candidatus Methanocorpusculum equi]MCQ2358095.1 hypothetical protein [Methanocorpusculum sp.]HJJ33401.1 hypothetical protein [Methanocorpusculum sp.]HJJ44722.1 hypothetical protein [Methanocorpusculum sp.]